MMISPYCGFFKEERDDEHAPPYDMCELCYRYDICKKAEMQEVRTEIEDGWIKEDQEAFEEYLKEKERISNKGDNYEQ